jgi:hypothetical protein
MSEQYRHVATGTVYVDVDVETWRTGFVRVETAKGSRYLVRTRNLERVDGDE